MPPRAPRRNYPVVLLGPLVLLPLLLIRPVEAGRAAWASAIIALFWATEAIPIAVTSLLPLFLYPMLGVLPADRVARNYFADKIVLFFGGLIIAAALEAVSLHRRIALRVLLVFGARPPLLLLGFMCATAFLSMWMSNTATAAMMMPIAEAVIVQLESSDAPSEAASSAAAAAFTSDAPQTATAPPSRSIDASSGRRLGKALVLGVAYAANIGGMATLTGTGPNLVLAGALVTLYPNASGISFATWMALAVPLALLVLGLAWLLLYAHFLRHQATSYDAAHTMRALRQEYAALGHMGFRERVVLADFTLLALLWISRAPKFVPGWGDAFKPKFVTDGTTAALLAVMLFILPREPPNIAALCCCCWRVKPTVARRRRLLGASVECSDSTMAASSTPPCVELGQTPTVDIEDEAGAGGSDVVPNSLASSTKARRSAPVQPHLTNPHPTTPNGARATRAERGAAAPAACTGLLEWSEVQQTLPWGVILLLGGGFALADACLASGLSELIGDRLSILSSLPTPLTSLLLMAIVALTTAVASNVATASTFVPIVAALADSMGIHPLAFMLPVTLTCSLAFVLPVSTPPNVMAFASGRLEVMDMVKVGGVLNVLGVFAVLLVINTTGSALFHLSEPPEWAGEPQPEVAAASVAAAAAAGLANASGLEVCG